VATAQSQGERLVPEGTTVQLLLLRQQSVRQDLNLAPAEREKIFEFTYKQHEAAEQALKIGAAERRQKFEQGRLLSLTRPSSGRRAPRQIVETGFKGLL
jgi:hypothetical protein